MKMVLVGVAALALAAGAAQAATPKTAKADRGIQDTFTPAQAVKAQAWLDDAMTVPMVDLLSKADVTNPQAMLEYGLALELGRPSASTSLGEDAKAKLKSDYRLMLDLYLTPADRKKYPELANANFENDAMLDNQEFWVDLAKQIGRPKERQPIDQTVPDNSEQAMGAPMASFIPDPQDEDNGLNLSKDLVLDRGAVNAAASCAESAAGFAKMKKAQTVDISETKLKPEEMAMMRTNAARVYRASYAVGIMACGSRDYFFKAAGFAGQNLGHYGALKDDPTATVVELTDADTADTPAKN